MLKMRVVLALALAVLGGNAMAGGCAPYRCVNVNVGELEARSTSGDLIVSFVGSPVGIDCDASGNAGHVVARVSRAAPSFDVMAAQINAAAMMGLAVTVEFENVAAEPCRVKRLNTYYM